jgi:hypothetical protein
MEDSGHGDYNRKIPLSFKKRPMRGILIFFAGLAV